ncbi:MAG TPA: cupin, partial [Pseudoxanthomonas sp.]|nr:cupin [Pseudoxanthomonas sp.]
MSLRAGDVLVIPAGVAHRKLREADGFQVVGAYPEGREPDMRTGLESERETTEKAVSQVPVPA